MQAYIDPSFRGVYISYREKSPASRNRKKIYKNNLHTQIKNTETGKAHTQLTN